MKIKYCSLFLLLFFLSACGKEESNLIINSGFEEPLLTGIQAKWRNVVHAGERAYDFSIDTTKAFEGNKSYKINQFKPQGFGLVTQVIKITKGENNTFEYTAMLSTQGVKEEGGLVLVINVLAADDYIIK